MASWQAHFFSFLLRHTFKKKLAASAASIEGIRKVMNGGPAFPTPKGVAIRQEDLAGVPGEWLRPYGETDPKAVLLYLHGGGYIACSTLTHRPATTFFAQRDFLVYAPEYRLAPEHRFPAGIDDAVAVYQALRRKHPSRPILVAGDSAGGGLALAMMLRLREEGLPLPAAAVLFSPLTDLTGRGQSRVLNDRRCAMFHGEGLKIVNRFYLPDSVDPAHPLASPLLADLRGLPPLLLHVGEDETLRDDSTALAQRASEAGVDVQLGVWPAVPHVWQLMHRMIPEGRKSLEGACVFLHQASSPH